jgi:hypothetical protein
MAIDLLLEPGHTSFQNILGRVYNLEVTFFCKNLDLLKTAPQCHICFTLLPITSWTCLSRTQHGGGGVGVEYPCSFPGPEERKGKPVQPLCCDLVLALLRLDMLCTFCLEAVFSITLALTPP